MDVMRAPAVFRKAFIASSLYSSETKANLCIISKLNFFTKSKSFVSLRTSNSSKSTLQSNRYTMKSFSTKALITPAEFEEAINSVNSNAKFPSLMGGSILNGEKPIIFDCSWCDLPLFKGRCAQEEFARGIKLKNAFFFDIDEGGDKKSEYDHMLPEKEDFIAYFKKITSSGIESGSQLGEEDKINDITKKPIVLYDSIGCFSAPRVWWTLKAFDFKHVYIIDGGIKRCIDEKRYNLLSNPNDECDMFTDPSTSLDFSNVIKRSSIICFHNEIKSIVESSYCDDISPLIIDARVAGRFNGVDPEPRPNIPSGHIPNSINIPFLDLFDKHHCNQEKNPLALNAIKKDDDIFSSPFASSAGDISFTYVTMKPIPELLNILKKPLEALDRGRKVILSCGSGLTASILYFGLYMCRTNLEGLCLYDGSWVEWAEKRIMYHDGSGIEPSISKNHVDELKEKIKASQVRV